MKKCKVVKPSIKGKGFEYLNHFKKSNYLKEGHNFRFGGFLQGLGGGLQGMARNMKDSGQDNKKRLGQLFTLFKD